MSRDLEAKIVILGAANVGKTSLLHRFLHASFLPPTAAVPTVGASFSTKRFTDPDDPEAVIRLQLWDTAGQERFRSISKLYYRGADAAILCYDITSEATFEEMGTWLHELRQTNRVEGKDIVIHVVGTKADVVAEDPSSRAVPFERCIQYVADNLVPAQQHLSPSLPPARGRLFSKDATAPMVKQDSNRSGSLWGQELGWDCCHEISAKDGEGVDEVFRVITRKLIDQKHKREAAELSSGGRTPGMSEAGGYFDEFNGRGSFRLTANDKRRSWLGFSSNPGTPGGWYAQEDPGEQPSQGRCC